jgi:hypothetical protein
MEDERMRFRGIPSARRMIPGKYEPLVGIMLALLFYVVSRVAPATWGTGLIICWVISLALVTYVDFVSGAIALGLIFASGFAISLKILTSDEVVIMLFIISALYPIILVSKARRPQPRQAIGAPAPQIPPQAPAQPMQAAMAPARQKVLHDIARRISRAFIIVGVPMAATFTLLLLSLLIPMWMVAIIGFMLMAILFVVRRGVGGIALALIILLAILYFLTPEFRLITMEQATGLLTLALILCVAGAIIWMITAPSPPAPRPPTPAPAPAPQAAPVQSQVPPPAQERVMAQPQPQLQPRPQPTPPKAVKIAKTKAAREAGKEIRFTISRIGAYTPSGLRMVEVEAPPSRAYLPDIIEAYLRGDPISGALTLTFPGGEVRFADKSIAAETLISIMRNMLPKGDTYFIYEYQFDEDDVRRAMSNAFSPGGSVIRVQRRKRDRLTFPLTVKVVMASEYIRHKFPSAAPVETAGPETIEGVTEEVRQRLRLRSYGKALHKAIVRLGRSRDVDKALETFMQVLKKDELFPIMERDGAVEDMRSSAKKALEAFRGTEIYEWFGFRYVTIKPRLILIGDSLGVYAQPDLKAVDDSAIYDIKTMDLQSAPREFEKVRLQMRIFQLAFPGAKAIILCIPYDHDKITTIELEPLTYEDAKSLLPELEKFCIEHGKEEKVEAEKRRVIVRYTSSEDEIRFEIIKPIET